ncbi:alpha/beta fold hydrolase [Enhygromyxa salina]|uniref:2-hydroxy-6-oxononadienedioate/2-hydroxy-6-oxononatrienedioate hydrolase n=1 Tax=Enhygromyxa salina TaxID=215803 RepID=A0A2S9XQK8_9BACT|nr:alpha/beta hydrolase [Enhygromyxa salina]PRP95142.1 2-hydroxy-6-oxononadienedioate/2-hydroxy-6-oxononatrienedioate hydrolase [Enhygromyxa salina]
MIARRKHPITTLARAVASALAVLGLGLGLGCGPVVAGTQAWTPPGYWLDEQFVEIEGLRICYLEAGPKDAETIVFVHGWSGNVQNWWDQFEHFQSRYRVIVFDAPGHGKSERGPHINYTMEQHVAVLGGLFDALEVERAIVIGNSGGGWIAAQFASQQPERVSKLVLSDATGTRYTGSAGAVLNMLTARWLQMSNMTTAEHYPGLDPKSQARQAFAGSFAGTVEEKPYLEALASLLAPTFARIPKGQLRQIWAPTLVIWGDDDPVVPINAMKVFDRAIADTETYVIHLGGHTPMMNSPDEFNCAVQTFLEGGESEVCKQYALTPEKQRDRLAGRDWGPRY